MFITSRGTMDKLDSTLRELLSARTELLGAIRLPNDAFKKNAGTEVTTDIVMLRKLRPGETPAGPAWKETAEHANDRRRGISINEYFAARSGNDARSNAARRWNVSAATNRRWNRTVAIWRRHWHRRSNGCRKTFTRRKNTRSPKNARRIHSRAGFHQTQRLLLHDGMVCIREENVLRPLDRHAGRNPLAHPAVD
jgi:hypothetical protein